MENLLASQATRPGVTSPGAFLVLTVSTNHIFHLVSRLVAASNLIRLVPEFVQLFAVVWLWIYTYIRLILNLGAASCIQLFLPRTHLAIIPAYN